MKNKVLLLSFAACGSLYAQGIGFFGNTSVHSGSTLYVQDYAVSFQGKVETAVSEPYGILSLQNTTITGAGDTAHADGWIESQNTGLFQFPTGDEDIFAPVSVESAAENALLASYRRETPAETGSFSYPITTISGNEFWNISGENEGILTLYWREESELGTLTDLEALSLAGWNSTTSQWEVIPHAAITGDLTAGSIVSESNVDFTTYTAFTFADTEILSTIDPDIANGVNLVIQDGSFLAVSTQIPIKAIEFYNVEGKRIGTYKSVNANRYTNPFLYPKGAYIAKIQLENGLIINKKVFNK